MCLRKSPARTPAFLSANRGNAQKCTGPRTRAGKARVSLNALKHGLYAGRLPKRLDAAGLGEGLALWDFAYRTINRMFQPETDRQREQARWFANRVFALGRRAGLFGTKPECGLFSKGLPPRHLSLFPIQIHDPWSRIGLTFWIQRKAYWTLPKLIEAVFKRSELESEMKAVFGALGDTGSDSSQNPNPKPRIPPLAGRVRCRAYRMGAPRRAWERRKYGLGHVGPGTGTPGPALGDPASHQADSSVGPTSGVASARPRPGVLYS